MPTADTIDIPNGVKGNFLHANRTLADIKVHWVPACFRAVHSMSCSSKYKMHRQGGAYPVR